MSAPSESVVARLVEHTRNRTTDLTGEQLHVPTANYTSETHAQAELALLRRLPVVAGRSQELPGAGSFVTRTVLGVPLILARQTDGSVAAYVNMCRHRGGQVEAEAAGSKRVFMCKYHGWTYERDGGWLRSVPFEDDLGGIDHACNGLLTLPAAERHGFIWIQLSEDDSFDVATYLGSEFDQLFTDLQLGEAVTVIEKSFTRDLNWKLVMDGANDPLHARFLHPEGVGKLAATNIAIWDAYGRHGLACIPRRRTENAVAVGDPVEATWRYFAASLMIYPNTLLNMTPDHVEWWTVWPTDDPGVSATNIQFLVRPDVLNEQILERVNRSWEILSDAALNEDWPMAESIQRNAAAFPDRSFLYGRNEVACQHLHRWLQRDLAAAESESARQ